MEEMAQKKGRKGMKQVIFLGVLAAWVLFGSAASFGGEIIGQLSDLVQPEVEAFVDITSAWVEKDGSSLTFVLELRGNGPDPADFTEPDTGMTYIWLVDADNNPNTGQSWVGNDFNVRVVVSNNPNWAGGFVDVVGAMGGGGSGTVQVADNLVKITIEKSQIGSPDYFSWRSDAAYWVNGPTQSYNGVTPESGFAQLLAYGVLYDLNQQQFYAEPNFIAYQCAEENPEEFYEIMHQTNFNSSGTDPIFLSLDQKYPEQFSCQVLAQAAGAAGIRQVRNTARFDVEWPDSPVFGISKVSSFYSFVFTLYGPEGSGPIPPETFRMKFSHDYSVFGSDLEGQARGWSMAQLLIVQMDPLEQKGVWVLQAEGCNNTYFSKNEESIDLAELPNGALEYGVPYGANMLLINEAQAPVPTNYAEAIADSTTMVSIEVAPLPGDTDGDGDVDLADVARLAEHWLMSR